MDVLLLQAEKDFKEIEKISQTLKAFSQKIEILEQFYFEDNWLEYKEELEKHKEDHFYATSEDGIWNLSVAYREERIKIIKQLAEEL